jgi:alkylation response protein AidB-like acyl-CoA dehydrogenase
MDLTEPQAGSDASAPCGRRLRLNEDGSYSLHGQKIYITWGDHDLARNIIQARPRAPTWMSPEGSRGVVPASSLRSS